MHKIYSVWLFTLQHLLANTVTLLNVCFKRLTLDGYVFSLLTQVLCIVVSFMLSLHGAASLNHGAEAFWKSGALQPSIESIKLRELNRAFALQKLKAK